MSGRLNAWLLVIVAVCAASIWAGQAGWLKWTPDEPSPGPPPTVDPTGEEPLPTVHLLILNGAGRSQLARDVGFFVSRAGCVAERLGNAPAGGHRESLLVNRRLERGRAEALARRLGGLPVLSEWDDRGTEDAVLLLGDDYEKVIAALDP